jgi:hypothetical protein
MCCGIILHILNSSHTSIMEQISQIKDLKDTLTHLERR